MTKHANRIRLLLEEGIGVADIARRLGCAKSTVSYHAKKLGLSCGPREKYDWEEIQAYYDVGHTVEECAEKFGFNNSTWSKSPKTITRKRVRIEKTKEEYNEYYRKYMLERYHRVRNEMIFILGGKCGVCGSTEELEIDHVDPRSKTMDVARMTYVCERRRSEELDVCQLLCKDCHVTKTVETDLGRVRKNFKGS